MDREPTEKDRLTEVNQKVSQVKQIMQHNIDIVIDRGVELNALETKADHLRDEAKKFKDNSENLKKKTCRDYMKWWVFLIIIIALILVVIALIVIVAVVAAGRA